MKIRGTGAISAAVPRIDRFLLETAHGGASIGRYALLGIETDEGLVGLGEVTRLDIDSDSRRHPVLLFPGWV